MKIKRIMALAVCVVILALCCSCGESGGGTSANSIKSIPELCELIGKGKESIPFYKTTDKNITVEENDYGEDYWCGYEFKSTDSKYCIAGMSEPPESIEFEVEDGKIDSIEMWLTENSFTTVAYWVKILSDDMAERSKDWEKDVSFVSSDEDGMLYAKEVSEGDINFRYRHNNIGYDIEIDFNNNFFGIYSTDITY